MTKQSLMVMCTAVVSAVVMSACGEVQDADALNHNCTILRTNYEWNSVALKLHHSDTRSCPYNALPGQNVMTGGTLHESTAIFPTVGVSFNVELVVFNTNDACATLGNSVGSYIGSFYFYDFNYDNVFDWIVQPFASYTAGTGLHTTTDCPVFSVGLRNTQNRAIAWTRVNYFGEKL